MAHRKDTAAQKQFENFVRHITELFLPEFGKSFMTQENTGNRWRTECDYKPEAEKFLILESRTYLHVLDYRDAKSTNPDFLKSLTNLMADYLSAYTMRAGGTRKNAKEALKAALYSENPYIQQLLRTQEQKRHERVKRTPQSVAARRKHERIERAKQAHDIHKQVMADFAAVNQYRKKR